MSQEEFAKRVGMTRKAIDYYERRAVNPNLDFIRKASEALGISIGELLDENPKEKGKKVGRKPTLQKKFEEVMNLPKEKQELIIKVIDLALKS